LLRGVRAKTAEQAGDTRKFAPLVGHVLRLSLQSVERQILQILDHQFESARVAQAVNRRRTEDGDLRLDDVGIKLLLQLAADLARAQRVVVPMVELVENDEHRSQV
jgi:hypothetical protein